MLRYRLIAVLALVGLWVGLMVLLITPPHPVVRAAPPLCVKPGGGNGCYSSLTSAVLAAQTNDTIQVATGTYTEYVVITKNVTLQGGWDISFTTRNPSANVTTLRPPNVSSSVVDIEGQISDTTAIAPTLDGFLITGGGGGNHGGGLRVRDSDAIIRNNVISGNVGYLLGGGAWVQRGAPQFENNRIQNNISDGLGQSAQGGGLQLENTRATLVNNIIAGNIVSNAAGSTGYGGGVDIAGGGPVMLTGNTILSNTGAITGTGYGGGISIQGVTVTLNSNLIQSNTADSAFAFGFGGAFGYGGGVYIVNSPAFTLTGNTILSNTAGYKYYVYLSGGGVEVESSAGSLTDNVFTGNRANGNILFGNGGGLAVFTSTLNIRSGQILNNVTALNCEGYGGGLYASNSSITLDATRLENNCAANTPAYGLGGGLAFFNTPYTLTNALIVRNRSFGNDTAVGGLYAGANSPGLIINNTFVNNRGQGIRTASPITLTNNIIMSHTTGISLTAAVAVSVTYNNFYANTTNQRGFSLDVTNIVINPQLDSNYHLLPTSPAIDAGKRTNVPATDFDGEPRIMAGVSGLYRVDIGADERTGAIQRVVNLDTDMGHYTIIGPGSPLDTADPGPNDYIGFSVLGADINGDGRDDLVTGAQDWAENFNTDPHATGRLYGLFNFGTRLTGTTDLLTDTASLTVVSKLVYQHVGQAFASGDLNGDGFPDLLFGSNNDDASAIPTPTVFALFGGMNLSGTRTLTNAVINSITGPADFQLRAPAKDYFNYSNKGQLSTGDLNGDGMADLVVGDRLADNGAITSTGAVFVIFGRSNLSGTRDLSKTPADYTLYGGNSQEMIGSNVIGRVNADSQPDLLVNGMGTTYVILGPITGTPPITAIVASANISTTGGNAVAAFDFTGDGQDDIIYQSGSNLYVVPGPITDGEQFNIATRAVLILTNANPSAVNVGNVTGDSHPDLLIGDPSDKRVFVIAGGSNPSGTLSVYDVAAMVVEGNIRNLGIDVSAGDLDFDGKLDLIIGSNFVDVTDHPNNYNDAGKVFVVYGDAEIVSPTVQFGDVAYTVTESAGAANISVTLSSPSVLTVTVDYATSNGTALAGTDYLAASGTLTFTPDVTTTTFSLTLVNDSADEPDETLTLTLSGPLNATLGVTNTAALSIVDDDLPLLYLPLVSK